jgi:predicted nucleic acid-binding protein
VTGLTLDTGALIAIEAGSPRMALLVEQAIVAGAELAIPAGVIAQAWRGGARQARIAKLLQLQVTSIVALDAKLALRIGARCASTRSTDVVDVSVAICASDRGHPVITSDPDDIAAIDPALVLVRPT